MCGGCIGVPPNNEVDDDVMWCGVLVEGCVVVLCFAAAVSCSC